VGCGYRVPPISVRRVRFHLLAARKTNTPELLQTKVFNGCLPDTNFARALLSDSSGHAESDLDVGMFDLKDANNLLYSAFNTLPANQSYSYGATLRASAVPDGGGTIMLLSFAMLGLNGTRRKVAKAQRLASGTSL
jgi:hypothetical protein